MNIYCAYDKIIDLDLLVEHPRNANKHPEKQLKYLAKIMKHQGWRHPITVSNRSGFIVAGHGRLASARLNGWTEAPVDYQDFESEADEYAHLIADNKIAELAEHDDSKMFEDLKDFPDLDLDLLGIPDLELPEVEQLEPQCDEDEVPDKVEPKAKPGDIYQLGKHRLMCGDSTNIQHVEELMNGEKADMVFTDPPYGVSYEQGKFTGKEVKNKFKPIANDEKTGEDLYQFTLDVFKNLGISTTGNAPYYVWSPPLFEGFEIAKAVRDSGVRIQSQLIWDKERLILGRADYHWQHEVCWYGFKTAEKKHYWCGDRKQTSIWKQKRDTDYKHPTQKPVELGQRAIENSTQSSNNSILDLFGGSGSTLIACEKTSRKCFMMELDPHYVDVIIARWEKYTGKTAELLNG